MGFISKLFGKEPDIKTKAVSDPVKQQVASPLSSFLSSQVGQGVPRFNSPIVGGASAIPQVGSRGIGDFLSIDPNEFFTENIQSPAIDTFREELAISREDFAGRLSGSGRFRSEEDQTSRFTRGLAEARANFNLSLPERQFNIAMQQKQEEDKRLLADYGEFIRTQPGANPALAQSLQFLQDSTSSGTTILSGLEQGTQGIFYDILQALVGVGASEFAARKDPKTGGA